MANAFSVYVIEFDAEWIHDKGQGTGAPTGVGSLAHTRGMMISMLQVEAIRAAQDKYGKGKTLTPEQVRWGFENLDLSADKLKALGFGEVMRPVKTSCARSSSTMGATGRNCSRPFTSFIRSRLRS